MIGVDGCGCASCCSIILMRMAVWELWKTAAISHSAKEVTTCQRVLHSIWIGALCDVVNIGLDLS